MTNVVEEMLRRYENSGADPKQALKEVLQEIVLAGLARAGFFKNAAFYGGTALRIFYGLDRFSEDLDFSLLQPDPSFRLSNYLSAVEREVRSYGFQLTVEEKVKTKDSNIQSAFIKGGTREQLLKFSAFTTFAERILSGEQLKVKFEVDVNPPAGATTEKKYKLQPFPYEIGLYDMSSLFAGKVHAVLCRGWKNRVKGRDLYDFLFFLSQKATLNIDHLQERLLQSGVDIETPLTIETVRDMLADRFAAIDFDAARADVRPFLKDDRGLEIWGKEFFIAITEQHFQ